MGALTAEQQDFLSSCRVAHLATTSAKGAPHVIPVCFALSSERCYIAIDEKPKRASALELKRVRNILQQPQVALIADRYSEDWSRLGYVLVHGRAELLERGPEHGLAVGLLRERYAQYGAMALEARPVIAITIEKAVGWGDLRAGEQPTGRRAPSRRSAPRTGPGGRPGAPGTGVR